MRKLITPLLLLLFVIAVIATSGYLMYSYFSDWSKSGVFGDSFGVVNALFSGLAFSGLIYTIFLQSKELELQREELKLTREEFAKAAEAQQEQARNTLLAAKIQASVSKQEIYSQFLMNNRIFPGHKSSNFGDMREYLAKLISETEQLVKND